MPPINPPESKILIIDTVSQNTSTKNKQKIRKYQKIGFCVLGVTFRGINSEAKL